MSIRSILRVIALTLVTCAFALALSTCGGGKPSTPPELGGEEPSVISVSPLSGTEGDEVTFSANVIGSLPLSYTWDFKGAVVDLDDIYSPTPSGTWGSAGTYESCTFTVTNAYGDNTFPFTLTVNEPEGGAVWIHTWGGSGWDGARGAAVDASGNIYVTGRTGSFGAGSFDLVLLKFSAGGSLLWQKTWGGSGWDGGAGVAVDASGNVYVTGNTGSFGAG
jgi:hypothetical protein